MTRKAEPHQFKSDRNNQRLSIATELPYNIRIEVQHDLDRAMQLHDAKSFLEVEGIYHKILKTNPNQPNALYLLGKLYQQVGKSEIAVEFFSRLIIIEPNFVEGLYNLGMAYHSLGNLDIATTNFQTALALDPNHLQAHYNLGCTLKDLGRLQEAISSWKKVTVLDSNHAIAHYNVGRGLSELGNNEQAVISYHKALAINPNFIDAHNSLGNSFLILGNLDEAIISFNNTLKLNPDFSTGHNNRGFVLYAQGKYVEACDSFQKAILADPKFSDARNNLGILFKDLGRLDEALGQFRQILEFEPENPGAHNYMSTALLLSGKLEKGWEEYEWRWKRKLEPLQQRNFPQSRWRGEPLQGKSILIWGEQGVGDEIIFSSMIPDVVATGAHCTIECDPRLVSLFSRSFPKTWVHSRPYTEAERGEEFFDYQIPAGSLFAQFRKSIKDFPSRNSYLVVDERKQKLWRERILSLGSGLKIGVSWRSGVSSFSRNVNYASISDLGPLFALKDVVFVNLQYDECAEELAEIYEKFGITLHVWDDLDMYDDLDNVAAMVSCLDVVVTCMTSVSMLSGGLGIPTLGYCVPNKNWDSLGTRDIPFHPSVRLFRRCHDLSFEQTISDIADEIRNISKI